MGSVDFHLCNPSVRFRTYIGGDLTRTSALQPDPLAANEGTPLASAEEAGLKNEVRTLRDRREPRRQFKRAAGS